MKRIINKNEFNPSRVGLKNGNFIGLPFTEEDANIVLLPVPWDVTASYGDGTAYGPQAILDASVQIDLFDYDIEDAWSLGIYMKKIDSMIMDKRNELRARSRTYINFLENGGNINESPAQKKILDEINHECHNLNLIVYTKCKKLIEAGKIVGLVGGDHSVSLGFCKALQEKYKNIGILQVDAHMDLRNAYEGFHYSHASIFNNILEYKGVTKLVQVGIRDYCEEEMQKVREESKRISVFFDQEIKENIYRGISWNEQCKSIIEKLPSDVYVSLDIDGLDPKLCPGTGTPVPGGLDFFELVFLIRELVNNGRRIIGFDLCETGKYEWDANVSSRILYKMCNLTGRSQGLI